MLSISPPLRGAGRGDYYLELAREDYYLEGGEPLGQWQGRGAEALGVTGTVEREELRSLLEGYQPGTERELVKNAGAENRQSAWDLTFSAPKSVSVLWSQADPETRKEIQAAQREAVGAAISYLDENACSTRRGRGGETSEPGKLVVATFEHGTSRAQDPQLHTHALVLNIAVREDGTTGTIESRELYLHKMAAGALYRAELASQLEQRLGVETDRKNSWFEVNGVSQELIKEFSKRREEIEKAISDKGLSSQRAHDVAALDTREVKAHTPREELFRAWQGVGREHGFSTEETKRVLSRDIQRDPEHQRQAAAGAALAKMTEHQSFFSERELVRAVAEEAQGRGLSGGDAIKTAKGELSQNPEIVKLGEKDNEAKYTTREMLELEKKMLSRVLDNTEMDRTCSYWVVDEVIQKRPQLSDEQKNAVRHVTEQTGLVACVSGMAGTGKSTMLEAAREAWQRSGCEVIGCALSGKAAQGLQEGAGIRSETLHRTLGEIREGKQHVSHQTVLVVDEAGMVGTRMMAQLVDVTTRSGAKLVLVGDARQLQPIDAGGPFKAIAANVGEAKLEEIRRQRESWSRDAVRQFADGDAELALAKYAERGLVTVSKDRAAAVTDLVKEWRKQGGAVEPEKHLILTSNKAEVREFNRTAQQERFNAEKLGTASVAVGKENFFTGDRVLFTRNSRFYGVKNGQLATVTAINLRQEKLTAKLDDGKSVTVPLKEYSHLQLGYAVTTHKAQGVTVENAYVCLGGSMQDRELSYVQASRARGETRFFVDKLEAGEAMQDLTRQMNKSHQKELAVSITQNQEKPLTQTL